METLRKMSDAELVIALSKASGKIISTLQAGLDFVIDYCMERRLDWYIGPSDSYLTQRNGPFCAYLGPWSTYDYAAAEGVEEAAESYQRAFVLAWFAFVKKNGHLEPAS